MRIRVFSFCLAGLLLTPCVWSQAAAAVKVSNSTIAAVAVSGPATAEDVNAQFWSQSRLAKVSLNRTPNLYDTDPIATNDIGFVEVRSVRTAGKVLVKLSWKDATKDTSTLEAVPNTPPETRFHKALVNSTDRFFDAAAVMVPANASSGPLSPSLQMGDPQQPVRIYYWNSVRGPMLMEAQGRGTTKRTGQSFPAQGNYQSGAWSVVFELPDLTSGTPVAFAIWNGSQQDRDGRKYFSVWQVLE